MVDSVVVLAYDFPHKKTQDFLLRLFVEEVPIEAVVAAPWKDLDIPPAPVRTKLKHKALMHPARVAERIGAPYHVVEHDKPEMVEFLDTVDAEIGVIAGARILKRPVIDKFDVGILNFHPGLIPEARGLDALLWSIHRDVPPGVTAHLVDERVDAGEVLLRERIELNPDDSLVDLGERLYETELELIGPAIQAARKGGGDPVGQDTTYETRMSPEVAQETLKEFEGWKRRHSTTERG